MTFALPGRRPFRAGAFGLLLLLSAAPGPLASAQQPAAKPPAEAAPAETAAAAPVLTLWDCRRIAQEQQPTLRAYRASLAFAEARAQALENLCTPQLLRPDLPLRREQARLGVRVARAQLCQAEWETTYNVTRNYISALYAREQYEVAKSAIKQLQQFRDDPDVPPPAWLSDRANVYIKLAGGRQQEALHGYSRAVAALREAMGVGPDFCLHLADTGLRRPPAAPLCLQDLVGLALNRRGELAQTSVTTHIAALEVDAQGLIHLPTANTFAAGSDIHAQPVAQGLSDGTYRPGAITIEMPTLLAGHRQDRVVEAQALAGRADAVHDKTRGLVTLEVEDAYHQWEETSAASADFADALKRAEAAAADATKQVKMNNLTPLDAFQSRQLATQTRLEYNTAVYRSLLALAALERITAGGFCPGFEALFAPPAAPAPPAALGAPNALGH